MAEVPQVALDLVPAPGPRFVLTILWALVREPGDSPAVLATTGYLALRTGFEESSVRRHLRVLIRAGVAARVKSSVYRLSIPSTMHASGTEQWHPQDDANATPNGQQHPLPLPPSPASPPQVSPPKTPPSSPTPPPSPPKPPSASRRASLIKAADEVIDRINERRTWVAARLGLPKPRGFKRSDTHRKAIVGRLTEGEELETLLRVIDARTRKIAREGRGYENLNPTTPFRPSNWAYSLGLLDAPEAQPSHAANGAANGNHGPMITDPAEAEAYAREHGQCPPGWVYDCDSKVVPA